MSIQRTEIVVTRDQQQGEPEPQNITVVTYKECTFNHAAANGGYALDGCQEFLPNGPEGTDEALTCNVCGCRRMFHKQEVTITAVVG